MVWKMHLRFMDKFFGPRSSHDPTKGVPEPNLGNGESFVMISRLCDSLAGHISNLDSCLRLANIAADFKTLKTVVGAKIKGEKVTDDKTMIMEKVIQLVSNLRSDSRVREELTNTFIKELWDSLDHPPLLYAGEKYVYRRADGSNNVSDPLPDLRCRS